jgi:Uma2 family endonuclease
MSAVLNQQAMTQAEFFDWAQRQDIRYEFDGFQPVAMTGGNVDHNQITLNILLALHPRLRGTGCRPLGPDAGVQTIGKAVRYPDSLITCTKTPGNAYLVPGVTVVFEVLSTTSGHRDRIVKSREYAAVPSIRRYVIVERESIGLTVHHRQGPDEPWTTSTLAAGEVLALPEAGIDVPVDEFYNDVEIAQPAGEAPEQA